MSFDFNVPFTRDAGIWANLLVETLKQSFSQISEQIANNNMRSELEDMRSELEDLKKHLQQALMV